MVETQWQQLYAENAFNTNIAAGAEEAIISAQLIRRQYGPFNWLMVHNMSAVNIQIKLDGMITAGKLFDLAAGETVLIQPEDGITFHFLIQKNLDAANAQVADKILFRWAKSVEASAVIKRV